MKWRASLDDSTTLMPCVNHGGLSRQKRLFLLRQTDLPPMPAQSASGFQARGVDAVDGEFLVAVFGIARDPDRADYFAAVVANQHAATLRENLITAGDDEMSHATFRGLIP